MLDEINNKKLLEEVKYLTMLTQQMMDKQDKIIKQLDRVLQNAKDWNDLYGEMNILEPAPEVTKEDLIVILKEINHIDGQANDLAEQYEDFVNFGASSLLKKVANDFGFDDSFKGATPAQYPALLKRFEEVRDIVWSRYEKFMKEHPLTTGSESFEKLVEFEARKEINRNLSAGD